jgi:hypothetical protein
LFEIQNFSGQKSIPQQFTGNHKLLDF